MTPCSHCHERERASRDGLGNFVPQWDKDSIDRLIQMHAAGMSFGSIAAELRRTRNAVIGKAHRLGLPGYEKPKAGARRVPPARPRVPSPVRVIEKRVLTHTPRRPVVVPDYPAPESRDIPLLALMALSCHWPVGEATGEHQLFCGAPIAASGSYCDHHHQRAYWGGSSWNDAARRRQEAA